MTCRKLPILALVGSLALLSATGCNNPAPEPTAKGAAPTPEASSAPVVHTPTEVPAQFAAARKTFDTFCLKCHSTESGAGMPGGKMGFPAGPGADQGPPQEKKFGGFPGGPGGPKGMMKGPNLAKVGADPKHTRDWLISFIRDPRSQKANARMPKFEGKIADDDLGALADYLGSLK